jgi:hypothetical protein
MDDALRERDEPVMRLRNVHQLGFVLVILLAVWVFYAALRSPSEELPARSDTSAGPAHRSWGKPAITTSRSQGLFGSTPRQPVIPTTVSP